MDRMCASRTCTRAALAASRAAAARRHSTAAFASFFSQNERGDNTPRSLHKTNATLASPWNSPPPPSAVIPAGYKPIPPLTLPRLLRVYTELSKARLTILNVLPAMAAAALFPVPVTLPVLLATAAGTGLCSASANALNQLQEVPYDAQMARTRNRPLVRRAISPLHATGFAAVTGIAGPAILFTMVNPTTAILGAANIALYAGVYTALKRRSTLNTPVGAVVGAIPPLMGWTAAGGHLFPSAAHPLHFFPPPFLSSYAPPVDLLAIDGALAPLALFALLYSWQIPHFNGLSHVVRGAYAQAGYRMLSVLAPARNAAGSLRHALALVPVCAVLVPLSGLTTWAFALTSAPVSAAYARAAWRFWRTGGEKEARAVFQISLWHLPAILGLMMVHKQGAQWWGEGEPVEDAEEKAVSA
jgi:protoheme IX farnesyltransferase